MAGPIRARLAVASYTFHALITVDKNLSNQLCSGVAGLGQTLAPRRLYSRPLTYTFSLLVVASGIVDEWHLPSYVKARIASSFFPEKSPKFTFMSPTRMAKRSSG